MKTILCLLSIATLILASGCATRTHNQGGFYGTQESQSGTVASRGEGYYWDNNGIYHEVVNGHDHVYNLNPQ